MAIIKGSGNTSASQSSTSNQNLEVTCQLCDGKREVKCNSCDGLGYGGRLPLSAFDLKGDDPNKGTKSDYCMTCKGGGISWCPQCNGTGLVPSYR